MLEVEKLQENAFTSIRLGAEDFQRCQLATNQGGDPSRALSAVRNLFAGVLLLFKYKIAISVDDPADSEKLLFNPPEILPTGDGEGGIQWLPNGNFKRTTIDVATVKKRFESFGISVDWKVIDRLQACRNDLEHLHPASSLGEVANFVAELFPVLRDFSERSLGMPPAEAFGPSWQIMLDHRNFFELNRAKCCELWEQAGVPAGMFEYIAQCKCDSCGSLLIEPHAEEIERSSLVRNEPNSYLYRCVACHDEGLFVPLLLEALCIDHSGYFEYGEEPNVEDCNQCGIAAFITADNKCAWCENEQEYSACEVCGERLGQDDQDNGGLCGYHRNRFIDDD